MAAAVAFLPWISMAFTVVGALSQANTARQNAQAQSAAADYNAQVARNQAYSALQESTAAQLAQRRRSAQLLGSQRAAVAQSGVGFGGSTKDILEQSETLSELDVLNLAYEGEMKSRGYLGQADLEAFNASQARRNARSATTAGFINAGSAIASFGARGGFSGVTAPKTTLTGGSYLGSGLRLGGGLGLRYS